MAKPGKINESTLKVCAPYLAYPFKQIAKYRIIERKTHAEIAELLNITQYYSQYC